MIAKKCDRCEVFYEPYRGTAEHKFSNMLIFAEECSDSTGAPGYYERRQFELCPSCMREATNFMIALMAGE